MKRNLGSLETQFIAYVQMRKLKDFREFDMEQAFKIMKDVADLIG